MSEKEKLDRLFNLKISPELRKAIKKDAYEKDKTASSIVREILEKHYGINKD
jgi:predicted DNA-binding protein